MLFPSLTQEQRNEIAGQIAELIDTFTNEGKLGSVPIPSDLQLCESCLEVILDLPRDWKELAQQSTRIEQWIRPQVSWYHQLRTSTKEFGFARSIKLKGGSHRVIEVVPSTVAREFQDAIRLIDAKESDGGASWSQLPAVLLHVPRYSFYGLATVVKKGPEQEGVDRITLVHPFFHGALTVAADWTQTSLLAFLSDLPDTFGAEDLIKSWRKVFPRLYPLLRRWFPF